MTTVYFIAMVVLVLAWAVWLALGADLRRGNSWS